MKAAGAFKTISEVAESLQLPAHVLRFWETKFPQIQPLKRGGGRRYYRPKDVEIIGRIRDLLHNQGYTIRGVQKMIESEEKGGKSSSSSASANMNAVATLPSIPPATTANTTYSFDEQDRFEQALALETTDLATLIELRNELRDMLAVLKSAAKNTIESPTPSKEKTEGSSSTSLQHPAAAFSA